jgi:outer membrane protein assembly factor BamB
MHAEPLIVGKDVIVATENDSLYDLDADTGQVIWHVHLGTPVSGGDLPCGDIAPSGITGASVIDATGISSTLLLSFNPQCVMNYSR